MPQVPRLFQQVDQRALPGNRVPTEGPGIEAFGGGQTIANAIQGAGDIVQDMYEVSAKNQIMEADAKLTTVQGELLSNPESGALNQKGEDAFAAPDYVNKAYDANVQQIEESLTNPMAKAAFKRMAAEKKMAIGQTLNKHISGEMEVYNKQVAKSFADSKMNFALANYQNPEIVKSSIDDVLVSIDESPAYRGMPQQAKDQMKLEYASQIHRSVIDRMIDTGDDIKADEYFQANKKMIAGKDLAEIEKGLEVSKTLGFAQREADKILSQTSSFSKAYEMAKSVEDPKKRQALNEELSRQLTIKKNAQREDLENYHRHVKNLLDQNGGNLNDPKVARSLSAFSLSDTNSLKAYAKALQEGKDIVTDIQFKRDLLSMAANPETRSKFAKMNLNSGEYLTKLNKSDWEQVFKEQQNIRQGKESKELKTFRGDEQVAKSILAQNRVNNKEKQAVFMNKFYPALEQFREENGRNPKDTEMQQIANQLMVEVVTEKGLIWDTKKRVFEMDDAEQVVELANPEDRKKMMTASNKPKTVMQNGKMFKLNEATGKYERVK